MDDEAILRLFQQRDENALRETEQKYRALCMTVAYNILGNRQDAEEIFSDALLGIWNAIPPAAPQSLGAYLLTAVRNAARNRLSSENAEKRGSGKITAAIDELSECLPGEDGAAFADSLAVRDALNRFLGTLSSGARTVFLRRYWMCLTVEEVAAESGKSVGSVQMLLSRTRKKLEAFLRKEDLL